MFLSRYKDRIIDKHDALVGRDNPLNKVLTNEINGRNLCLIPDGYKSIILGMGCFWGAEKIFWDLNGIYHTSVGYAGGYTKNPTYEEVCSGLTGHTEVRYSEEQKKVISEPVKLEQNYRNFDYESPWDGTKYIKEEIENNDKKN